MNTTSEEVDIAGPPQPRTKPVYFWSSIAGAFRRRYLAATLSVLGGLALWELVSRYVVANALFLAAPSEIAIAIVKLARSGSLWRDVTAKTCLGNPNQAPYGAASARSGPVQSGDRQQVAWL
jgi:hypothetical protein